MLHLSQSDTFPFVMQLRKVAFKFAFESFKTVAVAGYCVSLVLSPSLTFICTVVYAILVSSFFHRQTVAATQPRRCRSDCQVG